jgi:hypothetical protein
MELLQIFVACPGDVGAEKERIFKITDSLQAVAKTAGFILEVKEWSQAAPNMGRPQQVILDQIPAKSWDVFVGILWLRFGQPSGGVDSKTGKPDESGTFEEFRIAYDLWKQHGRPRMMIYQCHRPPDDPYSFDETQFAKVKAFFREFHTGGQHEGLVRAYKTVEEFAESLRQHLQDMLLQKLSRPTRKKRGRSTSGSAEINIALYRAAIRSEYRHLRLETLKADQTYYVDVELRSVFVPQDVRNCQKWLPEALGVPKRLTEKKNESNTDLGLANIRHLEGFYEQKPKPVLSVLRDPTNRHLVILGDPGAGKSSLAHVQLLEWMANGDSGGPVPFLIELRRYHREAPNEDFVRYLSRNPGLRYNPPAVALKKCLNNGTATLIFDGLDEVFDPQHRLEVGARIVKLTQEYGNARIFVTSRLVGYPRRLLRDAGFEHWLLQDFDESKIQRFLRNWCSVAVREDRDRQSVRGRVQTAISVDSIHELAGNPLLLTMMAMLARQSDLPRDQITLYQECSKLLLELWEANKALERDERLSGIRIDWRDKHELLCRVAWTMQNAGAGLRGNLIQRSTLEGIMDESLAFITETSQRRLVIELVLNQLRERNFILAHLGNEYYAFVHRGFLEFFCAEEIRRICSSSNKPPSQVAASVFKRHARKDAWKEVLILASANLPPTVADAALVAAVQGRSDTSNTPVVIAMEVLRRARNIKALPRIENAMRHLAETSLDDVQRLRDLLEIWPDDQTIDIFEQLVRRGEEFELSWLAVNFLCKLRPDEMTFQIAKAAITTMTTSINCGSILDDLVVFFPTHEELPSIFRQVARRKDAAEIFKDAQVFANRSTRLKKFIQAGLKAGKKRAKKRDRV